MLNNLIENEIVLLKMQAALRILLLGKFCDTRMSMEEIERQRIPLAERMVREPFWLGLITVLVVMIVIGVGYLVKKHLPEKIEKLLRTDQEAAIGTNTLDQNLSGKVDTF